LLRLAGGTGGIWLDITEILTLRVLLHWNLAWSRTSGVSPSNDWPRNWHGDDPHEIPLPSRYGYDVQLLLEAIGIAHARISTIWCVERGREMMFTIEFFRIREKDNAHAMLDRITHIASDLESAKVKAKSLFDTLNLPQNPDGLRILDQDGHEMFFWTPGTDNC
jgi:hypothetical protein